MKKDLTHIFIVDDDKILSAVLKKEIKHNFPEKDIVFSTFESGELCGPHIKHKPDIAIVDYHMNSRNKQAMNGIQLIDVFHRQSADTEIILLTGDDNMGLAVEALTHGATDYIVKNELMLRRLNISLYQCFKLRDMKRKLNSKKETGIVAALLIVLLLAATAFMYFFTNNLMTVPKI